MCACDVPTVLCVLKETADDEEVREKRQSKKGKVTTTSLLCYGTHMHGLFRLFRRATPRLESAKQASQSARSARLVHWPVTCEQRVCYRVPLRRKTTRCRSGRACMCVWKRLPDPSVLLWCR
jgi:hypothetical protein